MSKMTKRFALTRIEVNKDIFPPREDDRTQPLGKGGGGRRDEEGRDRKERAVLLTCAVIFRHFARVYAISKNSIKILSRRRYPPPFVSFFFPFPFLFSFPRVFFFFFFSPFLFFFFSFFFCFRLIFNFSLPLTNVDSVRCGE